MDYWSPSQALQTDIHIWRLFAMPKKEKNTFSKKAKDLLKIYTLCILIVYKNKLYISSMK